MGGGVIKMHVYGFIYIIWNYPNIYIIKIIDNKKQIEWKIQIFWKQIFILVFDFFIIIIDNLLLYFNKYIKSNF